MKFAIGKPEVDASFNTDGWSSAKEPGIIQAQLITILPSILLAILMVIIYDISGIQALSFYELWHIFAILVVFFLIIVPLHEFLHALMFPEKLASKRIIFGFYPMGLAFYAHYLGTMTRNRFLLVLIAPFLFISVVPMVVLIVFGINQSFLAQITIINALASSVDLLGILWVLIHIPSNATVRNKGINTYWQVPED